MDLTKQALSDIGPIETGIKFETREKMETDLSKVLADTMVLMTKTQVYHWNVVGAIFKPLHELTEEQYRDLFEAVDIIAERIRALGFTAPLSFKDLMHRTILVEEVEVLTPQQMLQQLIRDHEIVVRQMRDIAEQAEKSNDFVTHDLLVSRMAFHENAIWQLRATLTDPVTFETPVSQ
ncbi:MAG: Dps family protein [Methyloligellaceae bacterium]